ncbi:MAG: hypothetical protein SGJ10_00475 [Bacteroidota bacterium]|nr:hypothetical protein [Bacteroidota bacterium]
MNNPKRENMYSTVVVLTTEVIKCVRLEDDKILDFISCAKI